MAQYFLAFCHSQLAHNVVNATLAGMKADDTNPFAKGTHIVQE